MILNQQTSGLENILKMLHLPQIGKFAGAASGYPFASEIGEGVGDILQTLFTPAHVESQLFGQQEGGFHPFAQAGPNRLQSLLSTVGSTSGGIMGELGIELLKKALSKNEKEESVKNKLTPELKESIARLLAFNILSKRGAL